MRCALCGEPCSPWFRGDDLCDWCWDYIERKKWGRRAEQLRFEKEMEQRRLEEDMKREQIRVEQGAKED